MSLRARARARARVTYTCTILLALVADSAAERRDWVGSATCGSCHPKHLAAWQATRHAVTRDRFAGKPEARCLACHGTGEAPAGPTIAVEVGCESCHGAGAHYSMDDIMRNRFAAQALGLANTTKRAQICAACHTRATSSRPFDATAPVHPVKN